MRKRPRKPEGLAAPKPEPPLARADPFAPTSFEELEGETLSPAGWTECRRVKLSNPGEYPITHLRVYSHPDHDRGAILAVKTTVKKGAFPFVVSYRESARVGPLKRKAR